MSAATITVVRTVDELRGVLDGLRASDATVGFVPTMGALHDGHAELLRVARRECGVVVASCYVNPTQFGEGEDLGRYPRMPDHDLDVAVAAGIDVLWLPRDVDVYGGAPDDAVSVRVGRIGDVLEGASRPGHFDGVATVVVRLLGAVEPDRLYLGRKDHQQVVVLQRVVDDLLLRVDVREVDTVREPDGLARSSRNAYLSAAERESAAAIPRALGAAREAFEHGERSAHVLLDACRSRLDDADGVVVDYVELVHAGTVDPVVDDIATTSAVLLVAARVGTTRLIDNLHLASTSTTHGEEPT
jgi:pantoate--beta-alanine ligase